MVRYSGIDKKSMNPHSQGLYRLAEWPKWRNMKVNFTMNLFYMRKDALASYFTDQHPNQCTISEA